jgi:hypothetical protein
MYVVLHGFETCFLTLKEGVTVIAIRKKSAEDEMSGQYRIILQHALVRNVCFITSLKHSCCQGMCQQLQAFCVIELSCQGKQ